MKKILKIVLISSAMFSIFNACQETDIPNKKVTVLDTQDNIKNSFDTYLKREFVDKYNIELNYKLSDIELDQNQFVVPATYEQSIRMANIVKYLCFEPFDKVAPKNFLKLYFPKQLILIGSGAFRNNGNVVLGTAEAGRKISLYDVNNLDLTNLETLFSRYFRTIYHEFAHIWHQQLPFSIEFDQITPTTYKGDSWADSWAAGESLAAGYVSNYASSSTTEDFVELIAHYITFTPSRWDQMILDAGPEGGDLLNRKITIVKNYLLRSWSLDINELRDDVLDRATRLDEQDFDNIN